MSEISVAEATDDQEKVAARLLREDSSAGFSAVTSDALGVDERCHAILIGEEVVGFITYRHGTDYLQHLFVGVCRRRQGVASRAIHIFLEQLRAKGVRLVSMSMTPGSEGFWQRALEGQQVSQELGSQVIALR